MKRFTATEKWQDAWYRKLKPALKCLWQYLCDNCDQAGVIEPDWELLSFQIGEPVSVSDVSDFGERVVKMKSGKLLIVGFIEFQYGTLSEDCKAHAPVFRALAKHSLSKGYPKAIHSLKEKEEDKEEEEVKEKEEQGPKKDIGTMEEIKAFFETSSLPESDAVWFFNKCVGNGWTNGGKKIKDWKATVRSWAAARYLPSQKGLPSAARTCPIPEHEMPEIWDPLKQ